MTIWILIGLILAPLSYAIFFGALQGMTKDDDSFNRQEYRSDMGAALILALFTLVFPPACLIVFLATGFAESGLKWR